MNDQLSVELKSIDEQGHFEGYLSTFNSGPDRKGDVVEPGAFTDTLKAAESNRKSLGSRFLFPMLWNHDYGNPIGGFTEMREDTKGLHVKGELDLDCDMGRRAYSAMSKGYARGLSIGYGVVKSGWVGNRRHLKSLRLDEGSFTAMPVNQSAQVTEIKADDEPGERKAADFNTLDASDLGRELWQELSSDFRTLLTAFAGILADAAQADRRAAMTASLAQFVTDIEGDISEAFDEASTAGTELEPPGYLYLGSYSASPDDGMMSGEPDEVKAGRMLSSANHKRIRAAMDGLDGHLKGARGHVTDIRSMLKDASPTGSGDGAAPTGGPADAVKVKAEAAEETKAADPLAPGPEWMAELSVKLAALVAAAR